MKKEDLDLKILESYNPQFIETNFGCGDFCNPICTFSIGGGGGGGGGGSEDCLH